MLFRIHFLILSLFISASASTQKTGVQIITSGTNTSIRGMSIPTDDIIWVSGSNGTVGKSVDGGKTWRWMLVAGFEKRDFRDIHAFDSSTALIMAVDNPAYILRTKDGGKNWYKVFERSQIGMFLDAMDFRNQREGICIGDPIAVGAYGRKYFFIIRTIDGGESWRETPMYNLPPASDEEAIFSASGTNVSFLEHPDFDYAFVTGGKVSNIYFVGNLGKPSKIVNIPINQGVPSTGTFSLATDGVKKFYCIGGDYKEPYNQYDNFYYSLDVGRKWGSPSVAPPFGYRSCIRVVQDKTLVACGPNGVDLTKDGGKEWKSITKEGFHVAMVTPKNKVVFLAGEQGKVGRLIY